MWERMCVCMIRTGFITQVSEYTLTLSSILVIMKLEV